ncbi:hypothetical protein ACFPJ1_19115 [Kribbella qitaiheensis]|uniref:hypothetical protein n=1 Tax=Kribbella qitaiheensis TaxID=1544730 RepID=UPI00360C6552
MHGGSETTEEVPVEHLRFGRYLQELADVLPEDEAGLVRTVLRDPDKTMAQSAVVRHLDRRAAQLLSDAAFPGWSDALSTVIVDREFLVHRLREWTLLRSIAINDSWSAEDLLAASDWFQRTAAQVLTSSAALHLLADEGRTRRVRAAARRRLAEQHR